MATFHVHERMQPYGLDSTLFNPVELSILRRASELLARSVHRQVLNEMSSVREYLRCKLAGMNFEVFGVLWLDAQLQLVADEVLFRGTVNTTTVHPREVLKHAMAHNANACLLYHNHPSLSAEPSSHDQQLTEKLKRVLDTIEVRVLDHFVVAGDGSVVSFAQRGLI